MRRGVGHSYPFGKRRNPRTGAKRRAPTRPQNVGHEAKMRAERAGPVRTQRGKRPTVRPKPHRGPYTPEHHEGHRGSGKLVTPGSSDKRGEGQ